MSKSEKWADLIMTKTLVEVAIKEFFTLDDEVESRNIFFFTTIDNNIIIITNNNNNPVQWRDS